MTRNKFIFCQTAGLQGAECGESCGNATEKARGSGELKFCGEDGR